MAEPLRLYSKTGVMTDWVCPRKRYWGYEYMGRGIQGSTTHLELYLGGALHDGLAAIANGVGIDDIAGAAHQQIIEALLAQTTGEVDEVDFANEQATLVEGLLRGFHRHVWPMLMKQYPTIKLIETPMVYKHDGLGFMAKPDLVVADGEGNNWYVEYKSTSSKKEGWVNSWATAVQLHSTIRAIEGHLNEPVTGVIVQGLYKGFESYGKQSSPMCYCYRRTGNPPFSQTETQYEYKAGFKRYPTWELEGGVKQWVAEMPDNVLADQFPQAPPIFVKDDLINAFFQQRKHREHEIMMVNQMIAAAPDKKEDLMNTAYPQRFDQCIPSFGKGCPYLNLCHGPECNPLEHGYSWRDESHLTEFKKLVE